MQSDALWVFIDSFFRMVTTSTNSLNWCPVIVSNRQQVSPILSLAVISLLNDQ